jgi:hypothetical protein
MDLNVLLCRCSNAIQKCKKQSTLTTVIQAVLLLCLCGCMLWQCSTCLLKYLASPIGAILSFTSDLMLAPIAITMCYKGTEPEYKFPELRAIDVKEGTQTQWETIWQQNASSVTSESFLAVLQNEKGFLRFCKTLNVYERPAVAVRIRHYYSGTHDNPSLHFSFSKM